MTLSFQPFAGVHAIESCMLGVRFAQPVDPQTMSAIWQAASGVARDNDLPASQQIVVPQVLIGAVPGAFTPPIGHVFQRYAPNGQVEAELRCESQGVALHIRKYEGWTAVKGFLERTILTLLPLYVSSLPAIAAVTIQYDDKFSNHVDGEIPSAGELFRKSSRWVTVYDAGSNQPWHSHFGIFLQEEANRRELINVNVNVNDQADVSGRLNRVVGLTTLVGEMFDVPGQQPLIVEPGEATRAVSDLFEKAHDRQKQILQEVLSDDYLEMIGAKAN